MAESNSKVLHSIEILFGQKDMQGYNISYSILMILYSPLSYSLKMVYNRDRETFLCRKTTLKLTAIIQAKPISLSSIIIHKTSNKI